MLFKKNLSQYSLQPYKISELFGENVILSNAKPRFGRKFLIITSGLGQYPKITGGQKAKFVIVVKNDTPVAGYSEIFEQEISRKNV